MIAGNLGMDYRAEIMPEHKLVTIRDMATQSVMMIGDDINDAPVLIRLARAMMGNNR